MLSVKWLLLLKSISQFFFLIYSCKTLHNMWKLRTGCLHADHLLCVNTHCRCITRGSDGRQTITAVRCVMCQFTCLYILTQTSLGFNLLCSWPAAVLSPWHVKQILSGSTAVLQRWCCLSAQRVMDYVRAKLSYRNLQTSNAPAHFFPQR